MPQIDVKTAKYTHHCERCGCDWPSNIPHPTGCSKCRSRSWDIPLGTVVRSRYYDVNMPIPRFNHDEFRELPFIGSKCPYCKGTTGLDTFRVVAFCYSCDMTFSITSGKPLGVKEGIGLR